jgi:hypothetical protein
MANRLTKNEKRIATILARLPLAREQILVAMDEFGPEFDVDEFVATAEHDDPAQRNKVAVIEREIDLLTNLLEELAARTLDEGRRLGAVQSNSTHPWKQLAAEKVIPVAMAMKLREAKDTRNALDHFYPPTSWKAVHHTTQVVADQMDGYITRVVDWARDIGVDVPADR